MIPIHFQVLQCNGLFDVCIGLPGQGTCLDPNKQCDQLSFCCYSLAPPGAGCTVLQANLCQESFLYFSALTDTWLNNYALPFINITIVFLIFDNNYDFIPQSGQCVEPFPFIHLFIPPPFGNKFGRYQGEKGYVQITIIQLQDDVHYFRLFLWLHLRLKMDISTYTHRLSLF